MVSDAAGARGRFVRLGETNRPEISFTIDGKPAVALEGDTVLTAILLNSDNLGNVDFAGRARAGFCLMGACQDCWVWTAGGGRLRACTTDISPGMAILTSQPEGSWPIRA